MFILYVIIYLTSDHNNYIIIRHLIGLRWWCEFNAEGDE
jgi:hypothetical protein